MDIDEAVSSIWAKKLTEVFFREPLFVMEKSKNKNWKWYKFWKKRYVYDLVRNPKFGK